MEEALNGEYVRSLHLAAIQNDGPRGEHLSRFPLARTDRHVGEHVGGGQGTVAEFQSESARRPPFR